MKTVECEGKTYYYIEGENLYDGTIPQCIFLAGFDQLMLAYDKKESLYLKPENMRGIFNLSGIVMPALMLDGQVIGKWKKKNKKLSMELFSNVSKQEKALIKDKAESLWGDISAIDFGE